MKKTILNLLLPLAIVVTLGSCNNDDDNLTPGESQITLKGTAHQGSSGSANARVSVGGYSITHFQVGIQNLDMSYAAAADIKAGVNIGNLTLKSNANAGLGTAASQPKTHNFILDSKQEASVIGEGLTPNGNYTEVTFRLFKNNTAAADNFLNGKSLYIMGSVNAKPVRVWMTAEEPIRATAAAANGYEINTNADLMIRFNLNSLFANMNLATAIDGNNDGIIDIGPNNVDGNGLLHTKIKSNLNSSVEFVK